METRYYQKESIYVFTFSLFLFSDSNHRKQRCLMIFAQNFLVFFIFNVLLCIYIPRDVIELLQKQNINAFMRFPLASVLGFPVTRKPNS